MRELDLETATEKAHLVAFDGCHKIYVALDKKEATWFREHDYTVFTGTPLEMHEQVTAWFEESCSLRFVSATRSSKNGETKFITIIPQF